MATHSFTCKHAIPAFTRQLQSITAPTLAGTQFTVPRRVEGWVDLGGWLHTEIKWCRRESNSDTVTHPSTNRAQHRLTSLIKTNTLQLRQTVTKPLYKSTGWIYFTLPDWWPLVGTKLIARFHTVQQTRKCLEMQFSGKADTAYYARTHTHTYSTDRCPFNGLFSQTTWVSRHQKG